VPYHAWHNNVESTERKNDFYLINTKLGTVTSVNKFTNAVKQFIHERLGAMVNHLRQFGIKSVKIGESYIDRGEKRFTEKPTCNKYVFDFKKAMDLPILAMNVPSVEQIEGCGMDFLLSLGISVNKCREYVGSYAGSQQGISRFRPGRFYLAAVNKWIQDIPRYLNEMMNSDRIKDYERHSGSSDISLYLTKSEMPPDLTSASATTPVEPSELTNAKSSTKNDDINKKPIDLELENASASADDELLDQIHKQVDHELQELAFEESNAVVLRRLVSFLRDDKFFDFAESSLN
jgi:hypothetical protein